VSVAAAAAPAPAGAGEDGLTGNLLNHDRSLLGSY
jgi:hypothetical protein